MVDLSNDDVESLEFPIVIKEPKWEILGKMLIAMPLLVLMVWFATKTFIFHNPDSSLFVYTPLVLLVSFIILIEYPRQWYFLNHNVDFVIHQSYFKYRQIDEITGRRAKAYTQIWYRDIYRVDCEYVRKGKYYYHVANVYYFPEHDTRWAKRLELRAFIRKKKAEELVVLLRGAIEYYHKSHDDKTHLPHSAR